MTKYIPDGDVTTASNVFGYGVAHDHGAGAEAVRQRLLAREHHEAGGQPARTSSCRSCCPGIKVNTSPTDYHPIQQMQLQKWDGKTWVRFGDVISGEG